MKSSTRDQAAGLLHKVKGTIKEVTGRVCLNQELAAEGKKEQRTGKILKMIGKIEKVIGK